MDDSYSEKEKVLLKDFEALITRAHNLFFVTPAPDDAGQRLETLGCLVSKNCKWQPTDILTVAAFALEDANDPKDAERIQAMINK